MLKISLYYIWFFILFMLSIIFFFIGIYMMNYNYLMILDWEFLSINSCSMLMTFLLDWMSMMFVSCVFMISSMVILYSEDYMEGDLFKYRFLYLILLFIFSMFMMIMSPNLLSILIGWDGLGLVSYCLVIYFQNFKSYNAGMLTILMNRIGDVGILLSISWMMNFGNWHYLYYMYMWDSWMFYYLILLVLAGFTKSAQIPFSSWLPAAMAAPTPVSSLVHSSTLVTAGVYLLIRFNNLLMNIDLKVLLFLSLFTMFMSGIGANFEYDLKKIIALSTLSQLGLMMSILFLGFYNLSYFHLLTHAFFKALLFLCAGMVIHNMNNSQDIRHMGSLFYHMPFTMSCFCISSFSLCGFPFMSGFYSKDLILEIYLMNDNNIFYFFIYYLSLGLTVMYSFRLIYYSLNFYMMGYNMQMYMESYIMNVSMLILVFFSIFFGSMLMWLMFDFIEFIFLDFNLKILSMFMLLLGMILGYSNFMNNFLYMIYSNFYFKLMFSMYMIFTNIKNLYNLFKNYKLSYYLIYMMDMGWFEFIFSKLMYLIFSFLNKIIQFYEMNNIKLFMFSFIFLIMIILV
uniref:NADH-ubiquinone oxidoreductase chain 5 n=1 Tax=Henschiella sp. PJ-2015 TaxID=1663422 RepID=A0A342D248_9HEMI|nr:NADH dehydrogenase subunit 5 [Henschiella sp. PJ-2015]